MSEYHISQERSNTLQGSKVQRQALHINESNVYRVLRVVRLVFFTLLALTPLYMMLTTSIKPLQDVQSTFYWIPSHITFAPYADIWQTVPLAQYFLNSVVISGSATLISVAIAILAGYALSRFRFPGRSVFSLVVLSTQMFPGILFMLPLFIIFINIQQAIGIQLYGSYLGLIITYLTFSFPVAIWMLAGYFDSLPKGLEEAAGIDGASPFGTLFRIIIPISLPGIVAVAIYSFMTAWNELLFASILTTQNTCTLAVWTSGVRNTEQRVLQSAHGGLYRSEYTCRGSLPCLTKVYGTGYDCWSSEIVVARNVEHFDTVLRAQSMLST